MHASQILLHRFMEGQGRRFRIPVYQRNYDWKHEHCEQLFDDIMDIIKESQEHYFMGSIVSVHDDYAIEQIIIDGQQRLTTFSLLLLAICHLLDKGEVETEDKNLREKIFKTYLIDEYAKSDCERIRLKPVKNDHEAFAKLFDGNEKEYDENSNITSNYRYLKKRIKEAIDQNQCSIDAFFEAFTKLIIVDIKLNRQQDNPQLIFESLNAAGKSLEEGDLIRNYILMDEDAKTQERFYEDYWHPIEKNTHYRVSDFIRDFLIYSSGQIPKKEKVYKAFKKFHKAFKGDDDKLLKKLLQFSEYYGQIISSKTISGDENIDMGLKRINHLKIGVSYPFLIDVFHAWQSKKMITTQEVSQILLYIESFVFRRAICEIPTNALNKIFAFLAKNIRSEKKESDKYIDVFTYYLMQGSGNTRFPLDDEFKEKFKERNVYSHGKRCVHLLERLSNYEKKRLVDVENLLEKNILSIEHIMPQTLTPEWEKDLGDNYQKVHDKYLHTIGNLTLTAYNSEYQNKPFQEKRDMVRGYKECVLWLNRDLAKFDKWTEEEIQIRAKKLIKQSIKIWAKPPESIFQPQEQPSISRSFSDDFSFTGTKPVKITFIEETKSVTSWSDLFLQIVKMLDEREPSYFARLAQSEEIKIVSSEKGSHTTPEKIKEGIYIETNLSADGIVSNLKTFFEDNGLDDDDFEVFLKEGEEN